MQLDHLTQEEATRLAEKYYEWGRERMERKYGQAGEDVVGIALTVALRKYDPNVGGGNFEAFFGKCLSAWAANQYQVANGKPGTRRRKLLLNKLDIYDVDVEDHHDELGEIDQVDYVNATLAEQLAKISQFDRLQRVVGAAKLIAGYDDEDIALIYGTAPHNVRAAFRRAIPQCASK